MRGHRGIIEHSILSNDEEYDGLKIAGIQADVLDNDGSKGYVSVVDQTRGYHLMSEDGMGSFTFEIFPTRMPEDEISVSAWCKLQMFSHSLGVI